MEEGKLQAMPNLKKVTSSDGIEIERDYIDTYPKLYEIVKERFKEQKEKDPNAEPIIDLSNLKIIFKEGYQLFWIGFLAGKVDGIISLEDQKEFDPNSTDYINTSIKCEIRYEIKFENSYIYRMEFGSARFLKQVSFMNVHFMAGASLNGAIFECFVNLVQINIDQITFKNILFKGNVYLGCENWINCTNFIFSYNTFEGDVDFISCNIDNNDTTFYDFSSSIFNGDVCFSSESSDDVRDNINIISEYKKLSKINLNGSHFKKKLKIINVTIGDILMQNCHFDGTVNISRNKYDESSKIDFTYSTINSLFFMDSDLGGLKGEPIQLSKEISFSKSLITKEAFIFFRNINNGDSYPKRGTLNFEYANILGTVTIQDSKLELINLGKSTFIGDINIEDVETEYDSRESIVKVKDSYLKRHDIVNFLTYKAKEMAYYSDSLSDSFSWKNLKVFKSFFSTSLLKYFKSLRNYHFIVRIYRLFVILFKCLILPLILLPSGILLSIIPIKPFEKIREFTLLYLNRISNSFGMSWGRGVFFTCVTACAFFILINTVGIKSTPLSKSTPLFVWGWNGWDGFGDVWKYYLNMFCLLDFKEKFKDLLTGKSIELNAFGETLFFVSKIFVSYGIYQTISAFRKYGK
jgi:uncharacterized protein YjbI with pentapeptide repeats